MRNITFLLLLAFLAGCGGCMAFERGYAWVWDNGLGKALGGEPYTNTVFNVATNSPEPGGQ